MRDAQWPPSLWAESRCSFNSTCVDYARRFDVAIVGAGYTGLWTALYLKEFRPDLSVVLLDAVEPGFGASGRNGGWCSGLFPVEIDTLESLHGHHSALAMQRAAIDAVDDVGRYVSTHSIDCDWKKSGTLTVATNPVQESRLRQTIRLEQQHGLNESDVRWLDATELSRRVVVEHARGALFSPHCAALHPLKLVNGLVDRARALGVEIVGGFRATAINDSGVVGLIDGQSADITAGWVVRATEGYTSALRGEKRSVIPLYSYMVATEPLSDEVWSRIGWAGRETLAEGRLMVTYAQRTADGRIAFGGRGAGYRYASRVSPGFDTDANVKRRIVATLHELFPATRDAAITHHWGGPLAVPRDWHPSVSIDHATRRIAAGGYVGDGVALSHLTGRTVAAAICGHASPDLSLPFVQHHNKRWELEPLRWLGVNAGLRLPVAADALEKRTNKPARRLTALIDKLLG
jgi:glycine/D-amino acid oxidase-like deaminating enzyme